MQLTLVVAIRLDVRPAGRLGQRAQRHNLVERDLLTKVAAQVSSRFRMRILLLRRRAQSLHAFVVASEPELVRFAAFLRSHLVLLLRRQRTGKAAFRQAKHFLFIFLDLEASRGASDVLQRRLGTLRRSLLSKCF